jgi:hypothetical protein
MIFSKETMNFAINLFTKMINQMVYLEILLTDNETFCIDDIIYFLINFCQKVISFPGIKHQNLISRAFHGSFAFSRCKNTKN